MKSLKLKNGHTHNLLAVTIQGERVLLSPVAEQYRHEIFQEFTADITRYMLPKPNEDLSEVLDFIHTCRRNMAAGSELGMVIRRIENNEFLGICGLHIRNTPQTPELGIWLKKSAHGEKLGREAIHCLVTWARSNLDAAFLIYPVDRHNIPSRKIPESLGGVIFGEDKVENMSGHILDEVIYRITL
jgi:RimJ/RimL family protein N-acetyltransferase